MEEMEMMSPRIPIFVPSLPNYKSLETYLRKIDVNHHYSNFGPLENEVRNRLSEYLGIPVENIATCANATLGLEGAIDTSETLGGWDLPSWTFSATASALLRTKNEGRFLDVGENWRVIADEKSENLIDVLPFGQGVGNLEQRNHSKLNSLVIDAAAAFDSLKHVELPNAYPVAGVLSFHATKVLPAGEGGLFFSNSSSWSARFQRWTTFGMNENRVSGMHGTNAKMSEYHAAVLLASLDSWNRDRLLWIERGEKAEALTKSLGFTYQPPNTSGLATPYWIISSSDLERIDKVKKTFQQRGIQTREWWGSGCHTMPAYSKFDKSDLTNTENISSLSIGLPFWKDMSDETWLEISQAFKAAS